MNEQYSWVTLVLSLLLAVAAFGIGIKTNPGERAPNDLRYIALSNIRRLGWIVGVFSLLGAVHLLLILLGVA